MPRSLVLREIIVKISINSVSGVLVGILSELISKVVFPFESLGDAAVQLLVFIIICNMIPL